MRSGLPKKLGLGLLLAVGVGETATIVVALFANVVLFGYRIPTIGETLFGAILLFPHFALLGIIHPPTVHFWRVANQYRLIQSFGIAILVVVGSMIASGSLSNRLFGVIFSTAGLFILVGATVFALVSNKCCVTKPDGAR